ncbi:hypothetical protein AnigIFM50267_000336 [Aspergillus niger]|nr:hypothetical protein AnigIFM50267_000336 [Aspergillus niger]
MRATPAVKYPWSKLHLPLPRTPRQSEQLLNAITSSFRRQLDREYPTNNPSTSDRNETSAESSPENPHSSAHATDRLLHNILDNPLFRVAPSASPISSNASGMRDAKQRRMLTEPMVVFDELAAAGHVTKGDLLQCLQYQLMLARGTGDDFVKAMKDSRAGTKVVNWWLASGWRDRLKIFDHRQTSATLVKFMVAEGMQDTVLLWLKMLANTDLRAFNGHISRSLAERVARNLLTDFLAAENQYGGGLASAMRYYVQVGDMYFSMEDLHNRRDTKNLLRHAGKYLFQQVSREVPNDKNMVSATVYEEYARVIATVCTDFVTASVALYHPTVPDPKPFLRYVYNKDMPTLQTWPAGLREVFVRSGSVALRLLMDQGKRGDATWLAGILQHVSDTDKAKVEHEASADEKALLSRLLRVDMAWT